MNSFLNALLVLSAAAVMGCSSPETRNFTGPPGPRGEPGPPGPAAAGWAASGEDIHATNEGRVSIGAEEPRAKLDVNGDIYVEDDHFLLPTSSCRRVLLDAPAAGDLGDQIKPYLSRYRCVSFVLKAGTTWVWDNRVSTQEFQTVHIDGEGYENEAQSITVTLKMTRNRAFSRDGTEHREPVRMLVTRGASFSIRGVRIDEFSNDPRPLTPQCGEAALFVSASPFSNIEVSQIRITTSEDVVSVGDRGFLNVQLGHTFIEKTNGAPRDVLATKVYTGWCFSGGQAIIHRSHTTLGAGVDFQSSPKLRYTE